MDTFVLIYKHRSFTKVAITTAANGHDAWINVVKEYGVEKKYLKLGYTTPYHKDLNSGTLILEHVS